MRMSVDWQSRPDSRLKRCFAVAHRVFLEVQVRQGLPGWIQQMGGLCCGIHKIHCLALLTWYRALFEILLYFSMLFASALVVLP